DAYLRLDDPPDTVRAMIEREIGGQTERLGVGGWEIKKALRAVRTKSSPVGVAWVDSPLVYLEDSQHLPPLRRVADAHLRRPAPRCTPTTPTWRARITCNPFAIRRQPDDSCGARSTSTCCARSSTSAISNRRAEASRRPPSARPGLASSRPSRPPWSPPSRSS